MKIQLIAIEDDGYHLHIPVTVNGKQVNALIDTGASRTVFDENRLRNLIENQDEIEEVDKLSTGLGTNTMQSKKALIKELQLGNITISNFETAVLDLTHVNESYEQLNISPIDIVIGSDLLKQYHAVINYGKEEITFSKQ